MKKFKFFEFFISDLKIVVIGVNAPQRYCVVITDKNNEKKRL